MKPRGFEKKAEQKTNNIKRTITYVVFPLQREPLLSVHRVKSNEDAASNHLNSK